MLNTRFRQVVAIGALLFLIIFIAGLVFTISRAGKTPVKLVVIPKDAQLTVDGKKVSSGTIYISPGEHTFAAKKEDFETATKKIRVGSEEITINLLPNPVSEQALKWLEDNPDIQAEREAVGGEEANKEGQKFQENNPIISNLPLGYNQREFAIDYTKSEKSPDKIVLLITGETATSRKYAIDQIEEWGYHPSDYEIVFLDFVNPLASAGAGVE